MQITSKCTNCGKSFNLDDSDIGRNAECSRCGTKFIIAQEEQAVKIRPPGSVNEKKNENEKANSQQYVSSETAATSPDPVRPAPFRKKKQFNKVAQQYLPKNTLGDYLAFKSMIAPVVLQILFWISVAAILLFFIFSIMPTSATSSPSVSPQIKVMQSISKTPDWLIFVFKLIGVAILLFSLRLLTEVFILLFKIFDVLKEIKLQLHQ